MASFKATHALVALVLALAVAADAKYSYCKGNVNYGKQMKLASFLQTAAEARHVLELVHPAWQYNAGLTVRPMPDGMKHC